MSSVRTAMAREARPKLSLRRLGSIHWAVADQALISATNLVTMVLLARGLSQAAFGSFTLIYSALMLVSSFQSTLITQPHNILGATRHGDDYARYTTTTAIIQVFVLMGGGAADPRRRRPRPCRPMGGRPADLRAGAVDRLLAASGVYPPDPLHGTRLGAAFANDMISYGGRRS